MTNFTSSQNLIDFVKQHEGCKLTSYKPVAGEKMWTIGYGHYGVEKDLTISLYQAEQFLKQDLLSFEVSVNKILSKIDYDWKQQHFDALVDFAFNSGMGNLLNSTLLKKLKDKDLLGASLEFPKWIYGSGSGGKKIKLKGLIRRRLGEKDIFLHGNYKIYTPNDELVLSLMK